MNNFKAKFKNQKIVPDFDPGTKSQLMCPWPIRFWRKNLKLCMLFLVVLLSGCSQSVGDTIVSSNGNSCQPNQIKIEVLGDNQQEFCVRVADNDIERAKGLMYVEEMPENEGMLFVFDREDIHSFWMMNTMIPLDILFFDAKGELVDMKNDFQPCENSLNCPSYQSKGAAQYVLEVNSSVYNETDNDLQLVLPD